MTKLIKKYQKGNIIDPEYWKEKRQEELYKNINDSDKRIDDGVAGFVPVLGDVLQGTQAIVDASEGKWGNAVLGAGLLLLPNAIEKPLKPGAKQLIKYFKEIPKTTKLSLAERLGIPKANRNQFDRLQQEALSDLDDFINNKLPTKEYPKLEQAGDDWYRGSTNKGWLRFNKDRNSIFFRANDVDDWGEATATVIPGRREGVIKLTSPYADASYNISPEELPDLSIYSKTLPKDMVKRFWSGLDEYVPHKTYVSGDAGELPLGHDISNIYEKMHSRNRSADDVTNLINKLTTKQKYLIRTDGLSTDSYMSILKQGNRDGKALRFSNDGFTVFNEQGVKYKYINDLLKKQKVGEISNEEFIKAFDNWVKPYNGMSPIVKNGTIVIPHPFVLYKKIGGMLKC